MSTDTEKYGRYADIVKQFESKEPKKKVGPSIGEYAGALARGVGGGAVSAGGSAIRGLGEAFDVDAYRRAGDAVSQYGSEVSNNVSPAMQLAKAESRLGGSIADPSSISFGTNPSFAGLTANLAEGMGSIVPTVAAGVLSRGATLPTAVGAAMEGGAAAQQEGERVRKLDQAALSAMPAYQRLTARGMSPEAAREELARTTGASAAAYAAPVGAIGGVLEAAPFLKPVTNALGRVTENRLGRGLIAGTASAGTEATQEVAVGAAGVAGANAATGEDRSVLEGSFENAVMGAGTGGLLGFAGGVLSPNNIRQPTTDGTGWQSTLGANPTPEERAAFEQALAADRAASLGPAQPPAAAPQAPAPAVPPFPPPGAPVPPPAAPINPAAPAVPPVTPAAAAPPAAPAAPVVPFPEPAGPLSAAVNAGALAGTLADANAAVTGVMAAAQAAPVVPPAPEEPPTAEPKPLSDMSTDELSERLAYIRQQLRSGGSTAVIGRALREVRDEIARRSAEPVAQAPDAQALPAAEPAPDPQTAPRPRAAVPPTSRSIDRAPLPEIDREQKLAPIGRVPEPEAPTLAELPFQAPQADLDQRGEPRTAQAGPRFDATSIRAPAAPEDRAAALEATTPVPELPAQQAAAEPPAVAEDPALPAAPLAPERPATEAAPAPAAAPKRQKAIQRIERGTAYFATQEKADAFIAEAGLADTHEAVRVKPNRLEVREKRSTPQTPDQSVAQATAVSDFRDALRREAGIIPDSERAKREAIEKLVTKYPNGSPQRLVASDLSRSDWQKAASVGLSTAEIDEIIRDGVDVGAISEGQGRDFSAQIARARGNTQPAQAPEAPPPQAPAATDQAPREAPQATDSTSEQSAPAESQVNASGAADDRRDRQEVRGVDSSGVRSTEGGRERDAQSGAAPALASDVAPEQPRNVGAADEGETRRPARVRAPRADVAGDGQPDEVRDAADGRPRDGEQGAPDAGAGRPEPAEQVGRAGQGDGGRKGAAPRSPQPKAVDEVSPANPGPGNFHIANPLEIVGGGQVARFNKNQAAIEKFIQIRDEGRKPTLEEQQILAGYTGWGSFGQELFQGSWARPAPKPGWEKRDQWLRDHLGQAEWEGMQRSITNAHYTDPPTVLAMWDMVRRMGFKGGRVLEPSMGIGNFFGMMPLDLKDRSRLSGIELDPITGGMAQMLYPGANVKVMGYQDSKTPDDFYDVVIGNWPFENTPVADRRYNRLNPMLHDYFFLKTLDQVRPGGIVIGITSSGSMDKKGAAVRREMAKKAELVAAFRLPSGAFEEYAGTKVVTDIVILRKRPEPLSSVEGEAWVETVDVDTPSGEKVRINAYYKENPQNVVGTIDYGHGTTMFGPGLIVRRPADMQAQLERIASLVPEGAYRDTTRADSIKYIANHTSDREGSLTKTDAGLFIVRGEQLAPANEVLRYEVKSQKTTADRVSQLESLIEMRRTYGRLIEAERGTSGADAEPIRKQLREQYDAFVGKHKALSDSYGLDYLRKIEDPFYYALAALEVNENGKIRPAAILSRSTIRPPMRVTSPTIADAFVLARNTSVNPSIEDIASIAGKPADEVRSELVQKGAVFETPGGDVIPSDVYLSGNVREKLRQARAALAEGNKTMQRNVEALEKAQPPDIPYFNIEVQLGATWVPTKAYEQYIAYMLNRSSTDGIEVTYTAGRWKASIERALQGVTEASTGFGTAYYRFGKLVNAAISNQTVKIKWKDQDGVEYLDVQATNETNAKISEMRERFGEWLWSDPERRVEIEREYNEVRNAYASPKFDGSFLSFEGMALSLGRGPFNLREHQVNAIWRALVTRRSINAHEVGTGKTFTMGGIAVESRRYGIARKPMILAHNANSKSVAHEIQMMYPAAKILYIDNLSPSNIDVRLRQIANDDWDAIVIPHSLIDRLSFREETLMAMAKEEIEAFEREAIQAAVEDGVAESVIVKVLNGSEDVKKLRSVTAKELVKARARIIENIKKNAQQSSREGAVPFEELGIDMVMVDEAHEFKKPPFSTRMKMKGLQTGTSQGSTQLSFITRYVRDQNSGGNVHLFTGTPITNTLTEIFHQMRYIMADEMENTGVDQWDGWFGSFAKAVQDVELTAAGDYEAVSRLRGFINVPELRRMVGQYMDVVFAEDMPEMQPRRSKSGKLLSDPKLSESERAELVNGRTENAADRPYKKVINETSDPTPAQMRIFDEVQRLAAQWRQMKGKDRKEAMAAGLPVVPIMYEGVAARASFDARMVNDEALAGQEGKVPDHPDSKVSRAIRNLLEVYKSDPRATQVVFTNTGLGTTATRSVRDASGATMKNSDGKPIERTVRVFSPIKDMVERLVQQGVPRNEIAIVDGSTKKDERKKTADAMNAGTIRIVIGSTDSLGVGVNMQRNLRAMHHLDAPWMPGDLEQRNGRGHRQGNQWNTVLEYRYITDRIDGRRWQVLAIKQKFITEFLKSNGETRVIEGDAAADEENDSDILSTFAEAAGDPRVLIRQKLAMQIDQLQKRERIHTNGIADAKRAARDERERLSTLREQIKTIESEGVVEKISAAVAANAGAGFEIVVNNVEFNSRADADAALEKWIGKNMYVGKDPIQVIEYRGVDVSVGWNKYASAPSMYFRAGPFEMNTGRASMASLEAKLRAFGGFVDGLRANEAAKVETIQRLDEVAAQPFQRAGQLKKAKKQLERLDADMAANPVPPPAWLRNGAPVETDVTWNSSTFSVTGHRWSAEGWFVVAQDQAGREVVIPYMEATDSQGMPLYEKRTFEAPVVHEKKAAEQKANPDVSFSIDFKQAAAEVEAAQKKPAAKTAKTAKPAPVPAAPEGPKPLPQGKIRAQVLERIIGRISKDWAVKVVVVERGQDLPQPIKEAARRQRPDQGERAIDGVKGVRTKDAIYIVANRMSSLNDAMTTLAHEVVGHYGIESMLGARFGQVVAGVLKLRDQGQLSVADEVRSRYPNASDATFAKEAIALMAERGVDTSLMTQLTAAVRRFLRSLGFTVDFTEAEVRVLLAQAARHVNQGGAGAAAAGVDFSADSPTAPRIDFSFDSTIGDAAQNAPTRNQVVEAFSNVNADARPAWLKSMTRQMIVDVGKDQFEADGENLAVTFERLSREMEAFANGELTNPIGEGRRSISEIAQDWADMSSFWGNRGANAGQSGKVSALMHDTTLAGLDPTVQPQRRRGESQEDFAERMVQWEGFRARFENDLTDRSRQLYIDVRDAYAKRRSDFLEALVQRIEASEASGSQKRKMIDELRKHFESQRVKGPYFPLARFGDYWVRAKNEQGGTQFVMVETQAEQREAAMRLRKDGYAVKTGKSIRSLASEPGVAPGFVADIAAMIDAEVAAGRLGEGSEQLKDGLYQMFLQTLPEQSVRKNSIHRKGTAGFSQDALRAFSHQMGHGSKQLSRVRFAYQLADTLKAMKAATERAPDPNKAADIVAALDDSFAWMMNPTNARWANWATSLGFLWYLGVSPAAALVNLTQNAIVTFPVLASKYGIGKAMVMLSKSMTDYIRASFSKGSMAKLREEFTGKEDGQDVSLGHMLDELERSGAIDRTMTMSLFGLSDNNAVVATGKEKIMGIVGKPFHLAERANRESTAIAAYRLAREAGDSHKAAVTKAYDAVFESHFDYSSANRAYWMRGNLARVIFLFRQFALNMTYYLARNTYLLAKGASKQEKQQAATKLFGTLGMTFMAAGASGLPMYGALAMAASLIQGMFGDDDEPWDPHVAFRQMLTGALGETGGAIAARGVLNPLTGLDLASRTSISDLWWRSPDRDLEGRELAFHYMEQAAGPVFGGLFIRSMEGLALMGDGQTWKGVEKMVPKFATDVAKAARYWKEGATTGRGDPIVEDFNGWELFWQANGFAPAELSDQYQRNRALKNAERHVLDRRAGLLNAYALARKHDDREMMGEVMAQVRAFNRRWPAKAITFETIRSSMQSRDRFSQNALDGVGVDRKLARELQELVAY